MKQKGFGKSPAAPKENAKFAKKGGDCDEKLYFQNYQHIIVIRWLGLARGD
jgi:hypothetical protein